MNMVGDEPRGRQYVFTIVQDKQLVAGPQSFNDPDEQIDQACA